MYCYHCMSKNRDGAKVCVHCGKEMKADVFPHHLKPGTVLDKKYLVGKSIGEGGFGITYVGLDLTLDMKIAIKEFFPTGFANRNNTVSNKVILNYQNGGEYFKTGKEHFLSEAKNIAKFHSEKSIVDVRAYFEENETAYIIMEYLDGDNLSDELKVNGTYEPEALFRLFIPVMQTLKKMHREHIIHRDISPENVRMVSDGTLKLMDFGSARYYAGMEKRTMSVQYKPGFSPFEQYNEDGNQGPWTDVYGLCATIYKCITGKTPVDSVARSQTDTLKKPSEWGANISKPLEAVLMYGLAVYPENRCKDMDELIRLTERALRNPKKGIGAAGSATSYKTKEVDEPYKTMFADENHGGSINNQNNNAGNNSGNDSGKKLIITIVSIVATLIVAGGVMGFLVFNSVYKNDNKDTSTDTTIASETDDTSMTDISEEVTENESTEKPTFTTEIPTEQQTEEPTTEQPSQVETLSDAQELFQNIANKQFLMGASHTQSHLTVFENGIFTADYRRYSAQNSGTNYITHFTGRFTDVVKVDNYTYSMTVADIRVTTKTGMTEVREGRNFICTDFTGKMSNGSAVMLYTPETPVSIISERYSLSERNGKLIDGKMNLTPNGSYLGYYFLDTGEHYWEEKN